ncbi:DUF1206 domain-containing protein [uncultured Tateyamaria sp.]|uniref:DUF1206 domain-containing protein n=1 Tax=uncultured Tateyamaria sp. TaxID=455651 RepID=UPI00262E02DE|nr:DUF1206 domain-containing protein [uncultured Tateyamaria sp.]
MADGKTHEGLKWIMRAGYGARGVIYVIVGTLAVFAAFGQGQAQGTSGALATLQNEPMGLTALWAIAIGLWAYMIWRLTAATLDLEDHGTDAKGAFARTGQATTGLIHGAIGLSVAGLALGGGSGGGAEDWTAHVMQMPMGRALVGLAAILFIGAGAYYAKKGLTGDYKEHLRTAPFTRKVDPVLTFGLVVHGAIIVLVGVSLGFAALNASPDQAGGIGQALDTLRGVAWGRFVLAGAGLGLISFAIYNFVEAAYRVVPRVTGQDVKTLAEKATA